MAIGLVAVDEHMLIRLGLADVLADEPDIELVGEAGTAAQALRAVARAGPALVTTGLLLPDGDGIALGQRLRQSDPDLAVVLLTAADSQAVQVRAMTAGLSGYVSKSASIPVLLSVLHRVVAEPETFAVARAPAAPFRLGAAAVRLSEREHQVLALMGDGDSLPSIAVRLNVSEATVKTYVSRVYHKLRVNNRAQALMAAVRCGLLGSGAGPERVNRS